LLFFSPALFSYTAKKKDNLHPGILYQAYFQGLFNKDSIKLEELIQSRKMIVRAQGMKVSGFTITIEADDYDIDTRIIKSDSLSGADIQFLRTSRRPTPYIISFDGIAGIGNNGQTFKCEAFCHLVTR
jgi:hypothetical protein